MYGGYYRGDTNQQKSMNLQYAREAQSRGRATNKKKLKKEKKQRDRLWKQREAAEKRERKHAFDKRCEAEKQAKIDSGRKWFVIIMTVAITSLILLSIVAIAMLVTN